MTRHLRLIIAIGVMLCVCTASCARRVTLPPVPPELPAVIQTISQDETLTADQKAKLIEQALATTERIYQRILDRYESQGKNIKDAALQILAVAASVATLVWGVK